MGRDSAAAVKLCLAVNLNSWYPHWTKTLDPNALNHAASKLLVKRPYEGSQCLGFIFSKELGEHVTVSLVSLE